MGLGPKLGQEMPVGVFGQLKVTFPVNPLPITGAMVTVVVAEPPAATDVGLTAPAATVKSVTAPAHAVMNALMSTEPRPVTAIFTLPPATLEPNVPPVHCSAEASNDGVPS